jgi:hypothetical protein
VVYLERNHRMFDRIVAVVGEPPTGTLGAGRSSGGRRRIGDAS